MAASGGVQIGMTGPVDGVRWWPDPPRPVGHSAGEQPEKVMARAREIAAGAGRAEPNDDDRQLAAEEVTGITGG